MLVASIISFVLVVILVVMSMTAKSKIESFLHYVSGYFFSGDIASRINLLGGVDSTTLTTSAGDLVTYLRVRGASRMIGTKEFDEISERVAGSLQVLMSDGNGRQHSIGMGFLSDPDSTRTLIAEQIQGFRHSAKRMGGNESSSGWYDNKEQLLSDLCNSESIVIALYTLRAGLTQKESERYAQWMQEQRQKASSEARAAGIKPFSRAGANGEYSQPFGPVHPLLTQRHQAMVASLQATLGDKLVGIVLEKLQGSTALYYLRRFVDGTGVPSTWRPALLGSSPPVGTKLVRDEDLAHIMPPPIARQMFTEPAVEQFGDFETVRREGIWYGSLKMDVCPQHDPAPAFSQLKARMGTNFPLAVHFEVTPNGLEAKKIDQMFAGFFGGFGAHNRALKSAWTELKTMVGQGRYVCTLRVVATTWAKSQEALGDQISAMKMALQNWGNLTVSNESGAPLNMLLATAPGLSKFNPAPYLPAPIETVARLLPLYQACSPWDRGQLLLRTEDNLPYPVAMGSKIQAFWGTLFFAPPGRGKSFLMNCLNAGLLFAPGATELPYMTIIDKGMSSANVIAFAKGMLPPDRRHQAASVRLRNTLDYAINPFDTQLGMDKPTERERDFLINLVATLSPNLGPEGSRYIGQVLDAAFKNLGRESLQSRRWQRALDYEISARIEAEMGGLDENDMPRVWDVVDKLFDMDDVHAATQAQRFAVPILDDLINAAYADSVQDLYRNTPAATGEMITDVFVRAITTAAREYALLSTYTRFDVGDARVIAIDLEEVLASASSEESRRRAAVMILFARQMGAKNYFLNFDEIKNDIPERYKVHHARRIKKIFETLKFIEYDEFHNAHGMTDVLRMVEQDFREGRKYQVVPLLSSQLFGDFSKDLVETTMNFFILGVGSAEASRTIQSTFDLSETERNVILNKCLSPGPKGAPLFGMFKTDGGTVTQLLYNSASPMERWAFNSSALDVAVRKNVLEILQDDYWKTIELLVDIFPEGSARDRIDAVRASMGADDAADENGVTSQVAKEAVRLWTQRKSQAFHSH